MHIQKRAINPDTNDDYGQKSSIPIERKTHKCWRRFMNERAIDRAYVPTTHEHVANCLTHGCLIIPSLIAGQRLIYHAKTPAQYWSSIIYGNALIFLFSFSTVFHCSCFHPTYRDSTIKHLLHRVDRAIIYIFISASYTPWLLLRPTETISTTFTVVVVWIMAILGITYQSLYHERYKWLETCFYVIVGVFPALVIIDMTEHTGVFELAIGGLVFLLGIFFFKCDGIIPFAHAIWHCFVFFGAAIHYYAIYTHLLLPPVSQNELDYKR
jgi:monocyte-to-macrophage differentiation protein